MQRSDHFDGRRFFNPGFSSKMTAGRLIRMMRTPFAKWPRHVPVRTVRPGPLANGEDARVTFIGHASFLIQTSAGTLITDPMYSARPSPLQFMGPPRRVRAPGIAFDDLPQIDTILLSHNHYDHCDTHTLRALRRRFDPLVVTPLGNAPLLRSLGFGKIEELDWWDTATRAPLSITATPARHFSARSLFDRYRTLWSGFMLTHAGRRLYFTGDSAYGPHFAEIGRRLGAPHLALLPIGAYEPRWFMRDFHVNPAEAVQAHRDLGSHQSIGMHWGTFQLTAEAIDAPVIALAEALDAAGIPRDRFRAIDVGESVPVTEPRGGAAPR